MQYVELNRRFLVIQKKEESEFLAYRARNKYFGKNLEWEDLLNKRCIVLLAEASSGKTEEFRNKTEELIGFVCIKVRKVPLSIV